MKIEKNKKIRIIFQLILITLTIVTITYATINMVRDKKQATLIPTTTKHITNMKCNTLWVGSFNLAWKELRNEIGRDIIFEGDNPEILYQLNNENYSDDMLSKDSYYIKTGRMKIDLKNEIEKDLMSRKISNRELINELDFSEDLNSYIIYASLQKEFKFKHKFDRLADKSFEEDTELLVKYFGISSDSDTKLFENVEILFFYDNTNFAIKLLTNNNEEIILLKDSEMNSFDKIFNHMKDATKEYTGRKKLQKGDTVSIPYIEIDTIINYDELCGKIIKGTENEYIKNALQNVKFYLNETGGELKSETLIKEIFQSSYIDSLNFDFSSEFYIFMKEKDKEFPYMALKADNTDILVEAD